MCICVHVLLRGSQGHVDNSDAFWIFRCFAPSVCYTHSFNFEFKAVVALDTDSGLRSRFHSRQMSIQIWTWSQYDPKTTLRRLVSLGRTSIVFYTIDMWPNIHIRVARYAQTLRKSWFSSQIFPHFQRMLTLYFLLNFHEVWKCMIFLKVA